MNSIKQIEVIYDNRLVGRLALTKESLCAFEYSAEWLNSGFSISPFELPLRSGVFIAKPRPFDGGFGVFDDCLPDGWGLLILDRYLQRNGVNPQTLSLLDRLALVGSTGRGALEFRPDKSVVSKQEYADFEKLALEAEQILDSDNYNGEGIEEFQYRGGSPGGARPKIFTRYDGKEWLVKFRAKRDSKQIGEDEYCYSLLAKECGIEMPETRLFEDKYFGVERFDRILNGKLHVVSVAGLIGADYRLPSIDYLHIFKVCAALTHNVAEIWKVPIPFPGRQEAAREQPVLSQHLLICVCVVQPEAQLHVWHTFLFPAFDARCGNRKNHGLICLLPCIGDTV